MGVFWAGYLSFEIISILASKIFVYLGSIYLSLSVFFSIIATAEDDAHLEEFLHGRNSGRRIAICSEIEKNKNKFKVNGARMSLHDMRQELNNYEINENETVTSEVIEEELFSENGKCNRALQTVEC